MTAAEAWMVWRCADCGHRLLDRYEMRYGEYCEPCSARRIAEVQAAIARRSPEVYAMLWGGAPLGYTASDPSVRRSYRVLQWIELAFVLCLFWRAFTIGGWWLAGAVAWFVIWAVRGFR